MSRITPQDFQNLIQEGVPIAAIFDFRVETMEHGKVCMRAPFKSGHVRPGGTVSGPIMMTLADCTMYGVVLSAIGQVELAVTTNFNINFLQRPSPADLIAEGSLLKLGRRLAVCEITIYSEAHDDPVAHVTGTYSIPPQSPRRTQA